MIEQQYDSVPIPAQELLEFLLDDSTTVIDTTLSSSQSHQSWTEDGTSFARLQEQRGAMHNAEPVADIFTSDAPVWVHCHETGLPLFQLDDNTVAMYRSIDPSGKMLEDICLRGYKHPALKACKNNLALLAEICPQVFLCYLMHKFITYPTLQLGTWAWAHAMEDTDAVLCQLYDSEQLTDDDIADLVEQCAMVHLINNRAACTLALSNPSSITAQSIREWLGKVRSTFEHLPMGRLSSAINGMEQADWRYALTVQHLRPLPADKTTRSDNPLSASKKANRAIARKVSMPPSKLTVLDILDVEQSLADVQKCKPAMAQQANTPVQSSPKESLAALRMLLRTAPVPASTEGVMVLGVQVQQKPEPASTPEPEQRASIASVKNAQPTLLSKLAALRTLQRGK